MKQIRNHSLLLLIVLAFGHLTVDMYSGSLPALLPELRTTYGISYTQVGLLMLISQITSSVIQPLFGLVSDRISTRWLLPTSLLVTAAGLMLIGAAHTYFSVLLGVIVMGLGIAAYHPEASKLVHHVGGERKGRAMSIFAIGGNIGVGLGPALIGIGLAVWGMRGTLLFLPVTMISLTTVLWCLKAFYAPANFPAVQTGSERSTTEPADHRRSWRVLLLLLVIIFLRSGAHSSIMTFIPMYYTDFLGHSNTYSSGLLTTFLLAGALGTFLGGPLSDRLGARNIILGSFAVATPFVALVSLTSGGMVPIVLMALIGGSLISSFAVTTVLGQSLMPNNVGMASGLTLGFSVGTGGITATLLGWMADHWGLTAALTAIAVVTLLGGALALGLPRDRAVQAVKAPGSAA